MFKSIARKFKRDGSDMSYQGLPDFLFKTMNEQQKFIESIDIDNPEQMPKFKLFDFSPRMFIDRNAKISFVERCLDMYIEIIETLKNGREIIKRF